MYHLRKIKKGKFGKASKIREEYQEFRDAHERKLVVMELVELSDLIGAIEGYVKEEYGLKLEDLLKMKEVTRGVFENGGR